MPVPKCLLACCCMACKAARAGTKLNLGAILRILNARGQRKSGTEKLPNDQEEKRKEGERKEEERKRRGETGGGREAERETEGESKRESEKRNACFFPRISSA